MMNDYPPEYDGPTYCDVCGKHVDQCECPECPVCLENGNPECLGTHVAALPPRCEWLVVWDNGNAVDTLGVYSTEEAAKNAGEDWLNEMIAMDDDPAAAVEAYSYEVLPPKESLINTKEDVLAMEQGES